MEIFSRSQSLTVGVHTKRLGAMSTTAGIKWKVTGVICVGGGRAEFSLLCLLHLADMFCVVAGGGVNGEAVGWRETGFPHHHTGSA